MPTIPVEDEAHWLSLRSVNIGGSEIAALFNRWLFPDGEERICHAYEEIPEGAVPLGSCSPYTSAYRVYLEKTEKVRPGDFNSKRMQAGTYLEPAIAEWARNKWDWKLRKVRRYDTHPTIAGWGCSVDYEVHGPGMEPVELKNIDSLIAKRNWVIERDEVIVPPLHIILQLQHYIGARSSKRGWITAAIGGNELARGCFDAHAPTIAMIGTAIEAFWRGVRAGIAPFNTAEYDAVADEFAYGIKSETPLDLENDDEIDRIVSRYLRWKEHGAFTERVVDNLKARIALKIGTATKAKGRTFKATWPAITREAKIIPAREQAALTYRGGLTITKTS